MAHHQRGMKRDSTSNSCTSRSHKQRYVLALRTVSLNRLVSILRYPNICQRTHTYTHTYIHIHVNTHTNAALCLGTSHCIIAQARFDHKVSVHNSTHTHLHTHTRTRTHKRMYTYIYTYTYTYMQHCVLAPCTVSLKQHVTI